MTLRPSRLVGPRPGRSLHKPITPRLGTVVRRVTGGDAFSMGDWFENDDLFRRELEAGHRWAQVVSQRFQGAGLHVEVTPLEWRKDIDDRHRFAGERDLLVGKSHVHIESKSRRLHFTDDPATYPFDTAFVDTVSGWDQKPSVPVAVVLVSQLTEGMLVVPVRRTRAEWTIEERRDRVRDISDRWYCVRRRLLLPFDDLVQWLLQRPPGGDR